MLIVVAPLRDRRCLSADAEEEDAARRECDEPRCWLLPPWIRGII